MSILSFFPLKPIGLAALAVLVAACATSAHPPAASAQSNVGTNIPVLVMGEDEDPDSVKRSSDIFKRVIAELSGAMQKDGFRIIDEESVAVDRGWKIVDRRKKTELIAVVKDMLNSDDASNWVRVWVLFRIHAQAKQARHAVQVHTRIDGEIYDAANNERIDTFEMPREKYDAPHDCLESKICITEVVGDRAREIAGGLGTILARKLARYSSPRRDRTVSTGDNQGMKTQYTVTFRYFEDVEAITLAGVMREEFPGVVSMELMKKTPSLRRYRYYTTAKAFKLEEWLVKQLRDYMGFDVRNEVLVQLQGNSIIVDKLIPTPNRPVSADERKRFN